MSSNIANKLNQLCGKIRKINPTGGSSSCLEVTLPLAEDGTAGDLMGVNINPNNVAELEQFYQEIIIPPGGDRWNNNFTEGSSNSYILDINVDTNGSQAYFGGQMPKEITSGLIPATSFNPLTFGGDIINDRIYLSRLNSNTGDGEWIKFLSSEKNTEPSTLFNQVSPAAQTLRIVSDTDNLYSLLSVTITSEESNIIYDGSNIGSFNIMNSENANEVFILLKTDKNGNYEDTVFLPSTLTSTENTNLTHINIDEGLIFNNPPMGSDPLPIGFLGTPYSKILINNNNNILMTFIARGTNISELDISTSSNYSPVLMEYNKSLVRQNTIQYIGENLDCVNTFITQDPDNNYFLANTWSVGTDTMTGTIQYGSLDPIEVSKGSREKFSVIVKLSSNFIPLLQLLITSTTGPFSQGLAGIRDIKAIEDSIYFNLTGQNSPTILTTSIGNISLQMADNNEEDIYRNAIVKVNSDLNILQGITYLDDATDTTAASGLVVPHSLEVNSLSTDIFLSGFNIGGTFVKDGIVYPGVAFTGTSFYSSISEFENNKHQIIYTENLETKEITNIKENYFINETNDFSAIGFNILISDLFTQQLKITPSLSIIYGSGAYGTVTYGDGEIIEFQGFGEGLRGGGYITGLGGEGGNFTFVNPNAENWRIIGSLRSNTDAGSTGSICVNGTISVPTILQPLSVGEIYYLNFEETLGFSITPTITTSLETRFGYAISTSELFLFGPGFY